MKQNPALCYIKGTYLKQKHLKRLKLEDDKKEPGKCKAKKTKNKKTRVANIISDIWQGWFKQGIINQDKEVQFIIVKAKFTIKIYKSYDKGGT